MIDQRQKNLKNTPNLCKSASNGQIFFSKTRNAKSRVNLEEKAAKYDKRKPFLSHISNFNKSNEKGK